MNKREQITINKCDPVKTNGKSKTQQIPRAFCDKNEEWVKEYIKQFGKEPSFF